MIVTSPATRMKPCRGTSRNTIRQLMCLALLTVTAMSPSAWGQDQGADTALDALEDLNADHPLEAEDSPFFQKSASPPPAGQLPLLLTGKIKMAVLLIRFNNHPLSDLPPPSDYDTMLNRIGGDPDLAVLGSYRDYVREVTYNQLDLEATVVGWIDLPRSEQYYASGRSGQSRSRLSEALREAVRIAARDRLIDFTQFDLNRDGYVDVLTFIHSGYGSEHLGVDPNGFTSKDRIWSHQYSIFPPQTISGTSLLASDYAICAGRHGTSGSIPTRLGLIAHEAGHQANMPDLYDVSLPVDQRGAGIGSWGVMGNGWGFNGSGRFPTHPCALSKIKAGWGTVKTLTESQDVTIRQSVEAPDFYRIDAGFPPNEYILIENKQQVGFDRHLPTGGLAIWHVDENKYDPREGNIGQPGYPGQPGWPQNGRRYPLALLQADGRYDLEKSRRAGDAGDLFRAGHVDHIGPDTNPPLRPYGSDPATLKVIHRISNISASGPEMTFRYDVEYRDEPSPTSTERLAPIRGALASTSSFDQNDVRRAQGDVVLLQTEVNLKSAATVYISGDTSATSTTKGYTFASGLTGNTTQFSNAIKDSVRLVSIPKVGGYTSFNVNSRVRLPAGRHVVRWMVRSPNAELKFGAGGVLTVRAFPVQAE